MLTVDSYKSFPSGHATMSVATAVFMMYYLQLHSKQLSFWLLQLLQGSWALFAIVTSISRYTDKRHHALDVSVGATLGLLPLFILPYFHPYLEPQPETLEKKKADEGDKCSCEVCVSDPRAVNDDVLDVGLLHHCLQDHLPQGVNGREEQVATRTHDQRIANLKEKLPYVLCTLGKSKIARTLHTLNQTSSAADISLLASDNSLSGVAALSKEGLVSLSGVAALSKEGKLSYFKKKQGLYELLKLTLCLPNVDKFLVFHHEDDRTDNDSSQGRLGDVVEIRRQQPQSQDDQRPCKIMTIMGEQNCKISVGHKWRWDVMWVTTKRRDVGWPIPSWTGVNQSP
ncbi:unnamed protein product, partial [Cyprideis torosa]